VLEGYNPITACEIEFYLHGAQSANLLDFWAEIQENCVGCAVPIFKIEKERGREQFEVALCPETPEKSINSANLIKEIISKIAPKYGMIADFSAKPFADDFGSGLHIHIHLENSSGENLFYKDDLQMSDALMYSIGGLLAKMLDDMPIFAPHVGSSARFVAGNNVPLTVSWGANNRTTALRLPDSEKNKKRIEHRVAGADADVGDVVFSILAAIDFGIKNKIKPPAQIYGDASLEMYGLPPLFMF
jgi:glutamine synthetase